MITSFTMINFFFLTVYTVTAYSVCSKSRNFVLLENCVQYVDSHSVN